MTEALDVAFLAVAVLVLHAPMVRFVKVLDSIPGPVQS